MSLSVHIRHEVRPDRMHEVLRAFVEGGSYDHVVQGDRQLARLRQLQLISEDQATPDARAILNLDRAAWTEVFHFLHYTVWDIGNPSNNGFSWLYRQLCDYLWHARSILISVETLDPTVSFFINKVEESPYFSPDDMQNAVVSLSRDSLRGAFHFLEAIQPEVISDGGFNRRYFVQPYSLLLAASWVAQTSGGEVGIDLLLTPERREAICRLCLLETSALDQTLDWMLPVYPDIVRSGTTAGIYGRFIQFHKWPTLADLVA